MLELPEEDGRLAPDGTPPGEWDELGSSSPLFEPEPGHGPTALIETTPKVTSKTNWQEKK